VKQLTDIHNKAKTLARLIEHIKRPSDSDYCNCESIAKGKWVRNEKPAEKFKWNGKCVWDISSENQIQIIKFYRYLVAEKKSPSRIIKYLYALRAINDFLKKPFEDATKDDMVEVVAQIEEKMSDNWSKRDYKECMKFFYRWLRGMEKEDGYPQEVRWIKTKNPPSKLTKEDLLTKEEVLKMVQEADNIRDKCFVYGLWESFSRPEEFLSLKISSVIFTDWGCVLQIPTEGKTGYRTVPIVESAQYFLDWTNVHPAKENRDSPLWVSMRNKSDNGKTAEKISYSTARDTVKHLAILAGIQKRIYLNLFRHSGATRDSKIYKTPVFHRIGGWSPQSKTPERHYLHLDDSDVIQAKLEAHSILKESNAELKGGATILKCPRCQEINSIGAKHCKKCWFHFDARDSLMNAEVFEELIKQTVKTIVQGMFPEKSEKYRQLQKEMERDPHEWLLKQKAARIQKAKGNRKLIGLEYKPILSSDSRTELRKD
jgi:site-specific recombinase XerD